MKDEAGKRFLHAEADGQCTYATRSIDCGTTSCRFYVFDRCANVIASHQINYEQSELLPLSASDKDPTG